MHSRFTLIVSLLAIATTVATADTNCTSWMLSKQLSVPPCPRPARLLLKNSSVLCLPPCIAAITAVAASQSSIQDGKALMTSPNGQTSAERGELPLLTEVNNNIRFKRRYHDAAPMGHDRCIRARRAHLAAKTLQWHSRRISSLPSALSPRVGYADPPLRPPRLPPDPGIPPPAA
ncbi:hypothetical protein H257_12699 [Aphanomyces astaci]|uniref:Uncharacterized protein n=1 Tax=Aphanomyces astaci TaxID=112090 RepID=W4FZX8_APHAT|nr:hypothetical protein H257_12699 [Aphanomyces astaci]ETV72228.1 hypothetical protein H257_12699 [Aphanomyces astaci]|eukprot:XP_009838296.1 hypothetical protein H257_12699 [Aphanomyces astaci]